MICLHEVRKSEDFSKGQFGDIYEVDEVGCGLVVLNSEIRSSSSRSKKCCSHDFLHVPSLSYNLFSVSKATKHDAT